MTATRSDRPTCGAARPTPWAACSVSIMSSIRRCTAGVYLLYGVRLPAQDGVAGEAESQDSQWVLLAMNLYCLSIVANGSAQRGAMESHARRDRGPHV